MSGSLNDRQVLPTATRGAPAAYSPDHPYDVLPLITSRAERMRHLLTLLLSVSFIATAAEETRLLRFPTIHGDRVVFTYAGDLYAVATTGGTARKLTTDAGYESFPRFSPDGHGSRSPDSTTGTRRST